MTEGQKVHGEKSEVVGFRGNGEPGDDNVVVRGEGGGGEGGSEGGEGMYMKLNNR